MDLMTLVVGDGEDRKKKLKGRVGWGTVAGYEREWEGVCEGKWHGGERKTIKKWTE